MKPTYDIDPKMLDNFSEFNNDFYSRFTLRRAPKPLRLSESVEKDYLFPTFYNDVTCAMAVFLCSYKKAEKMMLHPKIKPVRMTRGRALLAFSCYEYKNVLGVAPYNEIAMTIPIMVDPGINVPVAPMILDVFKNFGYYVFSMPVTSLENQIRGLKIWGLPKVVQRIDVDEKNGECTTVGYEETGEKYFELRVPTEGKPTEFDVASNLYTRMGDTLYQSRTNFKATFNVTKRMDLLIKKGVKPDKPYLTLGDTQSAQVLKDLEIEQQPFQLRFAKGMSSCFDLPNQNYQAPFSFDRSKGSEK